MTDHPASQEASEAWQDVVPWQLKRAGMLSCYVYDQPDVDKARAADAQQIAALRAEKRVIACPACGEMVGQVASATISLALWQHWNWTCHTRDDSRRRHDD